MKHRAYILRNLIISCLNYEQKYSYYVDRSQQSVYEKVKNK